MNVCALPRAELVQGMELVITANVGTEGKVLGSEACEKVGVQIARSEVRFTRSAISQWACIFMGLQTDILFISQFLILICKVSDEEASLC